MNGPSPRDDLPAEAAGRGDNAPLKLEQFLPYRLNVVASLVSSIVVTHNLLAIVLTSGGFRRAGLLGVDRVRTV